MSLAGSQAPLAGRGIVITRPAHQARVLAAMVRAAGGRAILFPVIEILEARDLAPFNALVDRLHEFDLAVFISPNAVTRAMDLITARRALPPLPIAAIGRASVKALEQRGVTGVIAPARGSDSETLLALPALREVAGKRVVIFRGEGGRELLGDTLRARGAHVEYAECYRRGMPQLDAAALMDAWACDQLHAFVVTSSEGLHNLFRMLGKAGQVRLETTPVFVPHPRIAETAYKLGVSKVVTSAAGDEALLAGLCAYFASA